MDKKPDCYKCCHRQPILGDTHSSCSAVTANVLGHANGIKQGWFHWPWNFDPAWLLQCDSFKAKKKGAIQSD